METDSYIGQQAAGQIIQTTEHKDGQVYCYATDGTLLQVVADPTGKEFTQ